jgi:DNA-binding transcriptional LysR family regulator
MGQRSLQRRHLEAVVAVAEHRSVHAASRALGMPQPALSRLLSEAEALLGDTHLFERSSQGSRPTGKGERLVAHARFVLQGMQRLAEVAGESQSAVRVGCIARAMHTLMPLVLNRVRPEKGPGAAVQVKLAEASSTELLESLARAELDFAIVRGVGGAGLASELEMEPLYNEHTAIVCAPGHRIGSEERVSLSSLAAEEWVLPRRPTGSRILFDAFCSRHGLQPIAPVIEARSFETSLALVEKTRFLAIVPEPIARRYAQLGLVRVLRTREVLPAAPMMLAYATAAMDDPVLRKLRTIIREAAREARQEEGGQRRRRAA